MSAVWRLHRLSSRRSVRLPQRYSAAAWSLAVGGPLLITIGSRLVRSSVPPASLLFVTLLVVVAVALIGGVRPAITAVLVGLVAQEVVFGFPYGSLADHKPAQLSILVGFVVIGSVVGFLVDELARLTGEQLALRRVAALVVERATPEELFAAITEEVSRLLPVQIAGLARYESDGTMTELAAWAQASGVLPPVGSRWRLGGNNLPTLVWETGRSARTDDLSDSSGPLGETIRELGLRSMVASPVVVEGRVWGNLTVASILDQPLPAYTEARLAAFTELLSSAIANVESRAQLSASRARVVAAADDTRRRIERDLHDGAQQRLVSLGLELRSAQAAVPPEMGALAADLSRVSEGLAGISDELQEIARGIHPAALADTGLAAALGTLARRSGVPVELDVSADGPLPESVEVAAYYVVSEALTNAAKHARASVVEVEVDTLEHALRVSVRDDGIGGADGSRGSGLVGLKDRVEALGGAITVRSPRGAGTAVQVELPLDD